MTGQEAAKAYVNYDQDANSVTKSFNVSSTTDSSAGDFNISWTNSFDDAVYIVLCGGASGNYEGQVAAYYTWPIGGTTSAYAGMISGYTSASSSGTIGKVDLWANFITVTGDLA
jgi:hypothetical protein